MLLFELIAKNKKINLCLRGMCVHVFPLRLLLAYLSKIVHHITFMYLSLASF